MASDVREQHFTIRNQSLLIVTNYAQLLFWTFFCYLLYCILMNSFCFLLLGNFLFTEGPAVKI